LNPTSENDRLTQLGRGEYETEYERTRRRRRRRRRITKLLWRDRRVVVWRTVRRSRTMYEFWIGRAVSVVRSKSRTNTILLSGDVGSRSHPELRFIYLQTVTLLSVSIRSRKHWTSFRFVSFCCCCGVFFARGVFFVIRLFTYYSDIRYFSGRSVPDGLITLIFWFFFLPSDIFPSSRFDRRNTRTVRYYNNFRPPPSQTKARVF